ncbi:amino acid ABC transporter permease [Rhizobium phaseoli]|uniref:amino acid ABC transporter permease n=1 Tax=Rhizobium phaseoli TaxID=396 RepID=UPI0007EA6C20|nr:amino acid ABC transporter permease [Rhizobium phaseoli]ANL34136.1 general L-amino acid ABC transporter permease protein AapM [Rhizobium phaseoli]ANL97859.1 general L-amino acid ABC transporter permease protein AapM [Rhizobium phaseoli]
MSNNFVRTAILAPEPPPAGEKGMVAWIRRNLLATPKDMVLTTLAVVFIAWALLHAVDWLFVQAVWRGPDRTFCATAVQGGIQPDGWSGACWAFVNAKFDQFIYGRYPLDERWRPTLVGILFVLLLVPMLIPSAPRKGVNALLLFGALPIVSFFLLYGGYGLEIVETPLWGGLLVTLVLSFVGIAVSFPLGIILALGRRSQMPVIRTVCIVFIEVVRGVPLITVLFMASVMLPLFLPAGWTVDKLLRAIIGVSIFASAYMAEVIRGGLQAIPKGQFEGADSLGLGYWQKMRLIIMPQAIKLVIPGIVNTFIGMFKDTSLVSIISMFDLLGIVRLNFVDPNWATAVTPLTGLIFAGFSFWLFCFGMSRYSAFMERHLDTGHKR